MKSLTETLNSCLIGREDIQIDEASERFWVINGWTNPDNPAFYNVIANPYNTFEEAAEIMKKRYSNAAGSVCRIPFKQDKRGNLIGFWSIETTSKGATVSFSWLTDDKTAKRWKWIDANGSVDRPNGVTYL